MAKAKYIKLNKSAKTEIKETVKEVRSANAKAHEDRMNNCAAAVEGTVLMDGSLASVAVTKPMTKPKGVRRASATGNPKLIASRAKPKGEKAAAPAAPRAPLTESEAVKAGDAWIASKSGRSDRYGAVEASSPELNGKIGLTTTNFHDQEVDVTTGQVKYVGINPGRPVTPKPEKSTTAQVGSTKRVKAAAEGRVTDWSGINVPAEKADAMADMLLNGEASGRMVENATGLGKSDRAKVLRVLGSAGFKLSHRPNPDAIKGDGRTQNLYRLTAPAVSA